MEADSVDELDVRAERSSGRVDSIRARTKNK